MSLPYPVNTQVDPTFTDERFPGAVFVVTNGCAGEYGTPKRRKEIAHAHDDPRGSEYGLVCIQAREMPVTDNTLAHEYAHLLNANADAHGPKWRKQLVQLGFPEAAEEYKNRRRVRVTAVYADGHLNNNWLSPLHSYEHTVDENGRIDCDDLLASMNRKNTHASPIVKVFKGKLDEDPEQEYVTLEWTSIVTKVGRVRIPASEWTGKITEEQRHRAYNAMEYSYDDEYDNVITADGKIVWTNN